MTGTTNQDAGTRFLSKPFVRAGLIVTVLLIAALGLLPWYFQHRAEGLAEDWLARWSPGEAPAELVWSRSLADASARGRLVEQYTEVQKRADFHLKVMRFFYVRYYVWISMSATLGLLAALMLAFIGRDGWANADPTLVAFFLVFAACSAFAAGYPALYQQKDNIEANKASYLRYRDLDNRIRTFAISERTPEELIRYLQVVDREMNRLHALPIGLDDSALAAQRQAIVEALAASDGSPASEPAPATPD